MVVVLRTERRRGGFGTGGIRALRYFTELCSGSEAGSYLRLIDLCITQLSA